MRTRPLFWFYLMAFAISWLGWAPAVAASRGVAFFVLAFGPQRLAR